MNTIIDINDLSIIREYFSHNIRTSTAMIVASLEIIKCGLGEASDYSADSVAESSYFLDVYDKGMEICFDFVFGKYSCLCDEDIAPSKIITHFKNKLPLTLADEGAIIHLDIEDYTIKSNAHIFKSLLEMILCEETRRGGEFRISSNKAGGCSIIGLKPLDNPPKIYRIFAKIFKQIHVDFSYTNTTIELRFS